MDTKGSCHLVLKVGDTYLQDVWEEHEEDINYRFTKHLSEAMPFYEWQTRAPKYLWDDQNEKIIETLEEACIYFGGELKKVRKLIVWHEVE